MHLRKPAFFVAFVFAALLATTSFAIASPYSSVFVYGDSLSDGQHLHVQWRHDSDVASVL